MEILFGYGSLCEENNTILQRLNVKVIIIYVTMFCILKYNKNILHNQIYFQKKARISLKNLRLWKLELAALMSMLTKCVFGVGGVSRVIVALRV